MIVARPRRPRLFGLLGVLAIAYLAAPMIALVVRAPWESAIERFGRPGVVEALWLSAQCSTLATVLALLLGVPLAWLLASDKVPMQSLVRAIVLVPLLLPPLVSGVGLLTVMGRRGLVGQFVDQWFGITLPFTTAGVVVAVTFVALPFVVITMESGFRSVDPRVEGAAATLGAGPATVAWTITLPIVAPALAAGAALAWARSLGEFGATVAFAGSLEGRTQTLPLGIFLALESDLDQAILLSMLLLAPTALVLVVLRKRWRSIV